MKVVDRLRAIRETGWWGRHQFWVGAGVGVALGAVSALVASLLVATAGGDELEPGELVVFSGRDDSAGGQHQLLIDQWNRLHPRNQARIVALGGEADGHHAQMVAQAQSGGGDVDIYNLDVTWVAEFAHAGFIRPLDTTDLDTNGFLDEPLRTCRYDEQLWCLPFNTDAGLLYYRTDLVPQPPGSWKDIRDTIDRVLGSGTAGTGPPGVVAGYTAQLAAYEGLTVNALEAVQSVVRGSVVTDGRIDVDLDKLQEAVDRLRPTGGPPQVVLPESLDYEEQRSTDAFRQGKVLFMRNWPVAYRSLAGTATAGTEPTTAAVPFGVVPLPGASVLGGQNLAIARSSTKPRAAQALIEFLTSDYSEQILFERGGFAATRTIVYEDAEVKRNHPYAVTLLQAIQKAHRRPVTPCYAQFSEVFRTAVDQALRDDEPLPPDIIDTLNAALSDC